MKDLEADELDPSSSEDSEGELDQERIFDWAQAWGQGQG